MDLKKTALYDVHVRLHAKMVPFAGYAMPVQYRGIREEHRRVRQTVGVFDVSHMGEIVISGPRALDMVEKLTVNDVASLAVGQAQYTAMCYPHGGIVDDLLVYRFADRFLLVVNAANIEKDFNWMLENKIDGCEIENQSARYTQLAVQGKKAEATLQKLTDVDLNAIPFYWFTEGVLAGVPMIISRTGYTGEPGFELYFDNAPAEEVWEHIFSAGAEFDIEPIGLGARDSLRLEKKMCLYGNDIDDTTNPLEAGLGWITKLDKGDFIGREALQKIKEQGVTRRLVAFVLDKPGFPRKGYPILKDGENVGQVTSGTVSPILEKGIGLGYVNRPHTKTGTSIEIDIRGRRLPATIIKPPFV
ncbi:MAG: glycine cleavage system aminomethyltransferase GcvT [Calditrichaeota bacterium]|nr:MAG: glycine cleavage system aminomethyltransferase GcvT [Calditrichota bacterium]